MLVELISNGHTGWPLTSSQQTCYIATNSYYDALASEPICAGWLKPSHFLAGTARNSKSRPTFETVPTPMSRRPILLGVIYDSEKCEFQTPHRIRRRRRRWGGDILNECLVSDFVPTTTHTVA